MNLLDNQETTENDTCEEGVLLTNLLWWRSGDDIHVECLRPVSHPGGTHPAPCLHLVWIQSFHLFTLVALPRLKNPVSHSIYLEKKNGRIHTFSKGIWEVRNANGFVRVLNSGTWVHLSWRYLQRHDSLHKMLSQNFPFFSNFFK